MLMSWLGAVLAAFVGTGSAVLVLRSLSDTLIGHWLSKGLAKYAAQLETKEHRKRVSFERLDAQRSAVATEIMEGLATYATLVAFPPDVTEDQTAGPEVRYMQRYRELVAASQSVSACIVRHVHLFDVGHPFLECCVTWSGNTKLMADRFYDALCAVVDSPRHWELPMGQRRAKLHEAHSTLTEDDHQWHRDLVDACRLVAEAHSADH
jgi:hypothetical protein